MTYVYIADTAKNPDGSLNRAAVETGLKSQHTFGTSGPLVLFRIDSHIPGEVPPGAGCQASLSLAPQAIRRAHPRRIRCGQNGCDQADRDGERGGEDDL